MPSAQQQAPPSRVRCVLFSALVVALIIAVAWLPRWLVASGAAWTAIQLQFVYVGTIFAAVVGTWLAHYSYGQWRARKLGALEPSKDGLAPLGVMAGVFVAVLAVAHQLADVPVGLTARPACTGVQVHNVPYVAATFGTGLNVRQGPGLKYLQTARFDAGCTIGALGYCRGEPLFDTLLPVRDDRWLVLPHHKGYVSASAVFGLTAEDSLPDIGCAHELPPTPVTALTVQRLGTQAYAPLKLTAISQDAPNVGLALFRPSLHGEAQYRQLVLDVNPQLDHTTVTYLPALDHVVVPSQRAVYAVAVPCRAAGIPADPADARLVVLDAKTGRATALATPQSITMMLLLRTACRYASGDPIPIINGPNSSKP